MCLSRSVEGQLYLLTEQNITKQRYDELHLHIQKNQAALLRYLNKTCTEFGTDLNYHTGEQKLFKDIRTQKALQSTQVFLHMTDMSHSHCFVLDQINELFRKAPSGNDREQGINT